MSPELAAILGSAGATALVIALHGLVLAGGAPFLTGTIRKTKARLQARRGAPVLQPYRDLAKHWAKGTVESEAAGPVGRIVPAAALGAILVAALLVPAVAARPALVGWGDLIAVLGLLALARFAMALGALDAGSAFGGMGSSRDVSIAALVEPVALLALVGVAIGVGSTDLGVIAGAGSAAGLSLLSPTHLLAAAAFAVVVLAESGHYPVDNPDTHLELTMAHEGLLIEASGRRLALLMLAGHVKQALLLAIFVAAFLPWGAATELAPWPLALGLILFAAKVLLLGQAIALVDASIAKLRILRLPDLLGSAALLALTGLAARIWLGR
jgi:formate hydrogenlyase subunit 4